MLDPNTQNFLIGLAREVELETDPGSPNWENNRAERPQNYIDGAYRLFKAMKRLLPADQVVKILRAAAEEKV